jgi:exosortase A
MHDSEGTGQSIGARTWSIRAHTTPLFWSWALVVGIALALFWPSTQSLLEKWGSSSDDTYSHGYLVAVICCWIAWKRLYALRSEAIRPSFIAAFVLLLVSAIWLIALRAGLQTVHQALLPLILVLCLCAAFGVRIGTISGIAIAYLFFAIPVWSVVNPFLQEATVVATEFLLRATGVTASVTGNFIVLPAGVFEVAGGCSGLHYFIVALALAVLFGEVNGSSVPNRIRLVLLAIVLALAANWLRVYGIVLAGHLTDMEHYLVRVDHSRFGWVVFALTMIPFFVIGRRWIDPEQAEGLQLSTKPAIPVWGIALALLSLSLAPLLNVLMPVSPAESVTETFLKKIPEWEGPLKTGVSPWQPQFVGASITARADYVRDTRRIEAFTAVYSHQVQGRELIGHHNSLEGDQLEILQRARDLDRSVNELTVTHKMNRSLIWYFYEVGDFRTDRSVLAQVYYGVATIFGTPESRIVALRADCNGENCELARADLRAFLTMTSPAAIESASNTST